MDFKGIEIYTAHKLLAGSIWPLLEHLLPEVEQYRRSTESAVAREVQLNGSTQDKF